MVNNVNCLNGQHIGQQGDLAKRRQRFRLKMLGNRIKASAKSTCIGMWNGVVADAEKWIQLCNDCFDYACLPHVIYNKPVPLLLKKDLPAHEQKRIDVWMCQLNIMCIRMAMQAICKDGKKDVDC